MKMNPQSSLPPGFRFHPTDEELILHYLMKKVASTTFPVSIIADVDIYKFDPWELPDKAPFGEKEWYFFSPRDRKYPNGARPNRAAASGFWKATGTDKVIVASSSMAATGGGVQGNIGVKKALVFYKGRPPKGVKTNWIMHEYRLAESPYYTNNNNNNNRAMKSKDSSMRLDDWVLCRIYKKSQALSSITAAATRDQDHEEEEEQFVQETLLPTLTNPPINNTLKPQKSCSFSNLLDAMDYSMLSSFLSDNQNTQSVFEFSTPTINCGTPEQPFFSNYTNNSSSSSYLVDKLPRLSSRGPDTENRLKRQHSYIDEDLLNPSKKISNTCSLSTSINQSDIPQYSFLNQSFLNQQLLLNSYLQFQG